MQRKKENVGHRDPGGLPGAALSEFSRRNRISDVEEAWPTPTCFPFSWDLALLPPSSVTTAPGSLQIRITPNVHFPGESWPVLAPIPMEEGQSSGIWERLSLISRSMDSLAQGTSRIP